MYRMTIVIKLYTWDSNTESTNSQQTAVTITQTLQQAIFSNINTLLIEKMGHWL